MPKKAILVLSDGSVFPGYSFGAEADITGEVVFNTSMTGYQEMLTDPSYAGQIVVPTYPLIGNYGTNAQDFESKKLRVRGFVVREECLEPNHYLQSQTIHEYLAQGGIPGIYGVDTRALTRKLRSVGVMMGILAVDKTPEDALAQLQKAPDYGSVDFVKEVSTEKKYHFGLPCEKCIFKEQCYTSDGVTVCDMEKLPVDAQPSHNIVVLDCGLKYNIIRILTRMGCSVTVLPCTTMAKEILALRPDGIVLSPGPGDPALLDYIVDEVKKLVGKKPIMGICLGNQLVAKAFGANTFKLKFGHRGGNHPVKCLVDGKVYITAQNHGYSVDPDTVKNGLEVTHINLNDGTVEGLRHKELPVFCIQYHSEASPGPLDNTYLFEQFMEMIKR